LLYDPERISLGSGKEAAGNMILHVKSSDIGTNMEAGKERRNHMKHQNQTIALTVPADANFVDIVRLALYGIATKWGFSYEEIEDMKVAVAEACNNAVLHAYKDQAPGKMEVKFESTGNGMRISVKDEGSSFNYKQKQSRATSLHDKELNEINAGGLGIYMMQALMDEVEVNTASGTEVVLTKFLQRDEEMA
jgi:serine/threonine-protein kinase RsbW